MSNLSLSDSAGLTKLYDLDGDGSLATPFMAKAPALLGALNAAPAASPTDATASLSGLLRSIWQALINQGVAPTMNDYNAMGTLNAAVMKTTPGSLHMIAAVNLNASTRYLQLFDRNTAPTGTPLKSYPVYGNGGYLALDTAYFGISAAGKGLYFSSGIAWGMSTTPLTFTAATASETIVEARYL